MDVTELSHSQPYSITAPFNLDCYITVVVPVQNEAELLANSLESLAFQVDLQNRRINPGLFEIFIFANNCTDNSAEIARRFQKVHQLSNVHIIEIELPPAHSNIGFIRRWLMNEAYLRLIKNNQKGGVILTTDGDTCVAPDWIATNLMEINNGADAVGGRIFIDPEELQQMDDNARRFHLRDTGYRLLAAEMEARLDYVSYDYLPRHHQHFNGSFAVTTNAFRRAGGIPKVKFLEDVAFYQALMRVDARFRHSPQVKVTTSARRIGRTEAGLSTQINQWTMMGENSENYFVESARSIEQRITLRSKIRQLWQTSRIHFSKSELSRFADKIFIPDNCLKNYLQESSTFGSFLEKIYHQQTELGEWARQYPAVIIEQALADLRNITNQKRIESGRNLQRFSQTSRR